MRYFVTEFKNREAREDLKNLGLYCYSLRSKENDWGEIATIENNVLINLYGSIITDEEIKLGDKYPDDFISFDTFAKENTQVPSLCDLKENLKEEKIIDLSTEDKILNEFDDMFELEDNFEQLDELSINEKLNYILRYYKLKENHWLITNGGRIYTLYTLKEDNNG